MHYASKLHKSLCSCSILLRTAGINIWKALKITLTKILDFICNTFLNSNLARIK